MDFEDQLRHYFDTTDLKQLTPSAAASAMERMKVDFGLETDRGRRFALWTVMQMFGVAPDLDVAFEEEEDREAARHFVELTEKVQDRF